MSQQINSNPLKAWQVAQDAYLEAWSKIIIELAQTETYSKATKLMLNNYLTASIPFHQMLGKVMSQTLTTFNLASRTDVTNLAEKLTKIELKLDDINTNIKEAKAVKKPYQKKISLTNDKTLSKTKVKIIEDK